MKHYVHIIVITVLILYIAIASIAICNIMYRLHYLQEYSEIEWATHSNSRGSVDCTPD